MVSHRHKLGQGWISKDGVVGQANVGDVEVDELSLVVFALSEGDGEADLPYRGGGAVSDSGERLGRLKLIVWHLKLIVWHSR